MRIIGIDPGQKMGFAVLDDGKHVFHTTLKGRGKNRSEKMATMAWSLRKHFEMFYIIDTEVAMEAGFIGKFPSAAISLGESRGLVIAIAAFHCATVIQYTPSEIKNVICTSGKAKKGEVQKAIVKYFDLGKMPGEDSADALAIALCHRKKRKG